MMERLIPGITLFSGQFFQVSDNVTPLIRFLSQHRFQQTANSDVASTLTRDPAANGPDYACAGPGHALEDTRRLMASLSWS